MYISMPTYSHSLFIPSMQAPNLCCMYGCWKWWTCSVLLYSECLIVFCAQLSVLAEGALLINGTDCTGHARVVNAREREVDCPPAVNTVQVPVVDAAWEIQLSNIGYTSGCYKVVLLQNQSVVYYESKRISYDQAISLKLLVNTSMSLVECDNSYKTAYNTTRSSDCCQKRYHQFMAVGKDHGSLILYESAEVHTELLATQFLHGKPATCSVTGSKGRTASSSFTITTLNGEPNHMHCMYCGNVMLHMCMVHVSYLVHELRLEWMYLEGRVCIIA